MPCLTPDPDRLYELVPVVYRLRDADQGYPLKALLRVIAEQVNLVEQRHRRRSTTTGSSRRARDWVVPYIGSLIDYEPCTTLASPRLAAPTATAGRNRILFPRREVANTVLLRRRKGTLAALQEVATATSGWPTRVVEIGRQLALHAEHRVPASRARAHHRPARGRRPR